MVAGLQDVMVNFEVASCGIFRDNQEKVLPNVGDVALVGSISANVDDWKKLMTSFPDTM